MKKLITRTRPPYRGVYPAVGTELLKASVLDRPKQAFTVGADVLHAEVVLAQQSLRRVD